ncbi:hypothetical protein [Streptomyces sp. MS191]|uniref:hypothetical protein n=1 Tax=Streptomyces sp. ms191 TaxID=1827978 RepID=UPI0016501928
MIDLPGGDESSVRTVVGIVRECGASERVVYCAGGVAMLHVRAADPSAEIALTWTSLAPPRAALLGADRPRSAPRAGWGHRRTSGRGPAPG